MFSLLLVFFTLFNAFVSFLNLASTSHTITLSTLIFPTATTIITPHARVINQRDAPVIIPFPYPLLETLAGHDVLPETCRLCLPDTLILIFLSHSVLKMTSEWDASCNYCHRACLSSAASVSSEQLLGSTHAPTTLPHSPTYLIAPPLHRWRVIWTCWVTQDTHSVRYSPLPHPCPRLTSSTL